MDKKLYKMMDWPRIEGLVYAEEDRPHELLGGHYVRGGILIQAFFPKAKKVDVVVQIARTIKEYSMEKQDEAGFFAVLVRTEQKPKYHYCFKVTDEDGKTEEIYDPYSFAPTISEEERKRFTEGPVDFAFRILGSHEREIDGISGVSFAVWAPNALRVSVIGPFNDFDGRIYPMRRLADAGIFELFIPGLPAGTAYQYELRLKGGVITRKNDPYAVSLCEDETGKRMAQVPSAASDPFAFRDEKWMKERKKRKQAASPMAICGISLQDFPEEETENDCEKLAERISAYAKDTGFTHVELTDGVTAGENGFLYAPDTPFCGREDFCRFINTLHEKGIGVILGVSYAGFSESEGGLSEFDGTCLYGHLDMKKRYRYDGERQYNYARPEVQNYLLGNALYWIRECHLDGVRLKGLEKMIYLDYGKKAGEWVPNELGGNEDLSAVSFLKELHRMLQSDKDGSVCIADGLPLWEGVTAPVEKNGLGFDLKWDIGFTKDLFAYLCYDPYFRAQRYGELIYSLSYYQAERFILPFTVRAVEKRKEGTTLLKLMPGGEESKFANLRAACGYYVTHPGCLYFDRKELPEDEAFLCYLGELLHFYTAHPALSDGENSFEWIDCSLSNENIIAFLRKSSQETLLIALNFANVLYSDFKFGVPFAGKYKEIFNSDAETFGGGGNVNPRVRSAKKELCGKWEYSLKLRLAPLSMVVLRCTPV